MSFHFLFFRRLLIFHFSLFAFGEDLSCSASTPFYGTDEGDLDEEHAIWYDLDLPISRFKYGEYLLIFMENGGLE